MSVLGCILNSLFEKVSGGLAGSTKGEDRTFCRSLGELEFQSDLNQKGKNMCLPPKKDGKKLLTVKK